MSASILMTSPPTTPEASLWPWHPCAHCGEQGRIYHADKKGRLVRVSYCPKCLGVGSIPEDYIA